MLSFINYTPTIVVVFSEKREVSSPGAYSIRVSGNQLKAGGNGSSPKSSLCAAILFYIVIKF